MLTTDPGLRCGLSVMRTLVKELGRLVSRHGHQLTCSADRALGARERDAPGEVPPPPGSGGRRQRPVPRAPRWAGLREPAHPACRAGEAHVTQLTGLLRAGRAPPR